MKTMLRAISILAVSLLLGGAVYFAVQALSPPPASPFPDAVSSAAAAGNKSWGPGASSDGSGSLSPTAQVESGQGTGGAAGYPGHPQGAGGSSWLVSVALVFGKFIAAFLVVGGLKLAVDKITRKNRSGAAKVSVS